MHKTRTPKVISYREFWNAIREAYYSVGSQKKYRPMVGGTFWQDDDDQRLFVHTIAVHLGFKTEGDMTDYGAIIYGDDRPDLEVPEKSSPRCSTSNHFGNFLKHLTALRSVLKNAEKDGFCLDELLNALKDFEAAIIQEKSAS